jgi:hypothetical protein
LLSQVLSDRELSQEHKQNIADSLVGKAKSSTHKNNISIARKGIQFSDEHRKNLSLSHIGKNNLKKQRKNVQRLYENTICIRNYPKMIFDIKSLQPLGAPIIILIRPI